MISTPNSVGGWDLVTAWVDDVNPNCILHLTNKYQLDYLHIIHTQYTSGKKENITVHSEQFIRREAIGEDLFLFVNLC